MSQQPPSQDPPPYEDVAFWAPMGAGEKAWATFDLPPASTRCFASCPTLALHRLCHTPSTGWFGR